MFVIATEPFVFLACISFGVYMSIVPQLIVSKVCFSHYNATVCRELSTGNYKLEEKHVYDQATKWNSICYAAICVPSLFTTMVMGALSDISSKKRLLLLPPILLSIQTVILMLSAKFLGSSMAFVVLAAGLTSIYGDVQGYVMLAYSYMADVTEANQGRTVRMTILGGSMFVSVGISSFVSGILLKTYGFISAFSLGLAASGTNLIFVALILPETWKGASKASNDHTLKKKLSSFVVSLRVACVSIIKFFKTYLFSWKNKHVGMLLVSSLFTHSALIGEGVILVLFLKHRPLALSPDRIGEFVLVLQIITGFGVVILAVISQKCFKPSDPLVIIIGQISVIATYSAIGLSKDWKTLFGVSPLALAYSQALSGIRSMITKLVQPNEVSTALSCIAFVNIVSWVLITFSCNEVFRLTATYFPGMSMILLAISCFIGLLAGVAAFLCIPKEEKDCSDSQVLIDSKNYHSIA